MNSGLDLSQELAIGGQSIALGLLVVFVCLALIIAVITVDVYKRQSQTISIFLRTTRLQDQISTSLGRVFLICPLLIPES